MKPYSQMTVKEKLSLERAFISTSFFDSQERQAYNETRKAKLENEGWTLAQAQITGLLYVREKQQ